MLRFEPELMAHLIAPRPVLIVHGIENKLYGTTEASGLARAIGSSAELTWLDGAGHTEFMHDDDPIFGRMMNSLVRFFAEHLG
ncbi:MAG: alpha/beta hydrolase [Actinomycetia bacterium]|nr:alpha/beta hydrolase [Actinomycetes bacterium]